MNEKDVGICPVSGLVLPRQFIDEKTSLKNCINELLEKTINCLSHIKETYFLTLHAMFDEFDPTVFKMSAPKASTKIPTFRSNTLVYWVSPQRGICELLWMVAPVKKGQKLKVEFNQNGVAYLQAKGAMPT